MHPLLPALQKGLQDLGLSLSDDQQAQLLAYMDLIAKWTKVYNLTAVRDANEMLTHHLLDSLAVIAPLRRELTKLAVPNSAEQGEASTFAVTHPKFKLLDVGSGAACPASSLPSLAPTWR